MKQFSINGKLTDRFTVILDEPIPLPAGRVKVVVETISETEKTNNFRDTLNNIRKTLQLDGYQGRSKREIDEQLNQERESW